MGFKMTREYVQGISSILILMGAYFLLGPDEYKWLGVFLGGLALWTLLMSESFLLAKVQNELQTSLDENNKKRAGEVEDLLYYLRTSKLGNSPWSSAEAATQHIENLGLPAVITDAGGALVALNRQFTDTLGYGEDFVGELCHGFHRPDTYGEYVQGIAANLTAGKRSMHSRLAMLDVDGKEHEGTVMIIMLDDMRTAVGLWLPDDFGILKTV